MTDCESEGDYICNLCHTDTREVSSGGCYCEYCDSWICGECEFEHNIDDLIICEPCAERHYICDCGHCTPDEEACYCTSCRAYTCEKCHKGTKEEPLCDYCADKQAAAIAEKEACTDVCTSCKWKASYWLEDGGGFCIDCDNLFCPDCLSDDKDRCKACKVKILEQELQQKKQIVAEFMNLLLCARKQQDTVESLICKLERQDKKKRACNSCGSCAFKQLFYCVGKGAEQKSWTEGYDDPPEECEKEFCDMCYGKSGKKVKCPRTLEYVYCCRECKYI
jgi:hypothetical protein